MDKIDVNKLQTAPFRDTYVVRERAVVESTNDSTVISVESEYRTLQIANRPPEPIRVTKACEVTNTWRLIGYHTTKANGQLNINLTEFLNCGDVNYDDIGSLANANFLGSIPLFLATAHSSQPVFLTYDLSVSEIVLPGFGAAFFPYPGLLVNVIVRSWRHDGSPAPAIPFSWLAIGEKSFVNNP